MVDGISSAFTRSGPIHGDARTQAASAYGAAAATSVDSRADVSVSARAQLGARVVAAAHTSDGVDADLVARLGAALQAGTFMVSPDAIATAMLGAGGHGL